MGILREKFQRFRDPMFYLGFLKKEKEFLRPLKGHLFIKGYEKGNLIVDYSHGNIIVNSASVLIARLLKDNTEPSAGISYLAVGTGDVNWSLQDPPAPTTSATTLTGELERKAISVNDTSFIDPDTGDPVTTATNIVDYSVTFSEAEAVGALVEMGLFGGDATAALDSGTMINWRTFPVINKTNSMTLTIIFRITS